MEITAAITYSHDSKSHKTKVRELADTLISQFGIDVFCDCYEEDLPAGKLLTSVMERLVKEKGKVLMILTPQYKKKADEKKGGVGYETLLITEELYKELGSDKFIPVILDEIEPNDLSNYFPIFLTSLRKGIFRYNCENQDDFIRQIAGAITNRPKQPKPQLGLKGWEDTNLQTSYPISITILDIIDFTKSKVLYEQALFYARLPTFTQFKSFMEEIKLYCINQLLTLKEVHAQLNPNISQQELTELLDKFVECVRPFFLVCFAGFLSGNENLSFYEEIMFDLLSIEKWNIQSGAVVTNIHYIPQMLVYVYHHLYGALHINTESPSKIHEILRTKLPLDLSKNSYQYLHLQPSITGWIASLGHNYINSFKYIFNAYERWNWLNILFKNEELYKEKLTTYQMFIHILDITFYLKNHGSSEYECIIPPAFILSGNYRKQAERWLIKNSSFFKEHLSLTDPNEIQKKWEECYKKNSAIPFTSGYYLVYLPYSFLDNLLM